MTARLRRLPLSCSPIHHAAILAALVSGLGTGIPPVCGAAPLRALIARELAPPGGIAWPVCPDSEFLRRVSLDLTGMPPSADEARAFLTSTDPARRERLVDRLLASPHFARHLSTQLDLMLMERRPNTHVSQDEWQAWLMKAVRDNKPWNELVRELLLSDGESSDQRAAGRFLLDRGVEPHVVARDIGRIFLGRDMQCAQCHDSPLVSDFLQQDYHGLLAITTTIVGVAKKIEGKDVTVLADRAGGDLTFESVFIKGVAHRTGSRIPGDPLLNEPVFLPGEEYLVAPADGVRSVPKFNRREALAMRITDGSHRWFNENIANRIWAMLLGRGLVHPLDMLHPDNPAVSPSLLRHLGEQFAASNFNLRELIREIVLSDVYQRPFELPPDLRSQPANWLPALTVAAEAAAGQATADKARRAESAVAWESATSAFQTAEAALIPVAAEVDAARAQYAEAWKKAEEARQKAAAAEAAVASRRAIVESLTAAQEAASRAAQSLPDDATLTALAQQLAGRRNVINGEIPALELTATDLKAAVTAPAEALPPLATAVQTAAGKLDPLATAVRTADAASVEARRAASDAGLQVTSSDAREAVDSLLTSTAAQLERVRQLQAALPGLESLMAAAEQAAVQAAADMTRAAELLRSSEATAESARQQLTIASQQLQDSMSTRTHLTTAQAALQRAASALAGDAILTELQGTLNSRMAGFESQITAQRQTLSAADSALSAATTALDTARREMTARSTTAQTLDTELAAARQAGSDTASSLASAAVEAETATAMLHQPLADRVLVSQLKPLTPEQLCWSIFKVTTVYDRYVAQEIAELDKTAPLTPEQEQDPAAVTVRQWDIEQRVFDKLKGHIGTYVSLYGGGPGQPQGDFYASADQALFTANGGTINGWVSPAGGNATERIIQATDPRVAAEELYLGILSRFPDEPEVEAVTHFLAQRTDRTQAAQELVWGLISSAEFRFNK
jgi:hypothetical protein